MTNRVSFAVAAAMAGVAAAASADVFITEFAYSAADGEFIEFTNLGDTAIDLTGWSYDDDSRTPGVFALSGILAAGESLIITEADAEAFRTAWGLSAEVQILGGVTNNLGRNDEINLYNSMGELADRLTYGDQLFAGSIRTQGASGNPGVFGAVGGNDINAWQLSTVGDAFGSFTSAGGDIGNPGRYIPAPGAVALLGLGGLVATRRRR